MDELEAAGVDVASAAAHLGSLPADPAVPRRARPGARGARRARRRSAPPAAASARPTRTRSRAARSALQDLFTPRALRREAAARCSTIHNFVLQNYFKQPTGRLPEDARRDARAAPRARADGRRRAARAVRRQPRRQEPAVRGRAGQRCSTSTTAPIRTSPRRNCVAGAAAAGAGVGPQQLHYVLGITKAYTHARGQRAVPDRARRRRRRAAAPARATSSAPTTGRPRRCGWFDAAALKRSIQLNGVSGLCITKLDVLDGLETVQDLRRLQDRRRHERHPAGRRRGARALRAGLRGACRAGRKAPSA